MGRFVLYGLTALAAILLPVGAWLGLSWVPPERAMGDVSRIMYVHVPTIWAALIALLINFAASVAFLFKNSLRTDALAEAAAEVGVVMGAVGVVLGAIWGRPTWGVWWTWDPRLTTAAIMLVAYTGYLALRRFVEDPDRRATWSAVVAIIAAVDLPILWFSVKWWRSLHQVQSNAMTLDREIRIALYTNAIAFIALMIVFVWHRTRIALRAREEEIALPDALPGDAR